MRLIDLLLSPTIVKGFAEGITSEGRVAYNHSCNKEILTRIQVKGLGYPVLSCRNGKLGRNEVCIGLK